LQPAAARREFHHQTARQTREGGGLHPPYLLRASRAVIQVIATVRGPKERLEPHCEITFRQSRLTKFDTYLTARQASSAVVPVPWFDCLPVGAVDVIVID
jgi:hypothetical protein